jgi:ABC-type transport system involved in multi-copper enzyme maturation permease subunit
MKILTLIMQTFRELVMRATLIVLLGISSIILIGLALALSSSTTDQGTTLLIFGLPATPPIPQADFESVVLPLESSLAGGLITGIVLLGIFATAGIIPNALEKGSIDLYISKPLARWEFLLGKFAGAVAVIGANTAYFITLAWLIVGLRLGVWNGAFLMSILTITCMFACIYALVLFLGLLSRSSALTIIVVFVYLFVIAEILEGREGFLYRFVTNQGMRAAIDTVYYILPQIPAVRNAVIKQIAHQTMDWVPFAQSFATAGALYLFGTYLFKKRDL